MYLTKGVLVIGLVSLAHASRLYVSSYSGNITTVEVTEKADGVDLKATFLSQGCSPSPSWLEYHSKTSTLFCADEGFPTPKANFTSFKVEADGSLTFLDRVVTLNGGVNTLTYMAGSDKLMAVAHYGGSGISIVNTTDPSALDILKTYFFTFGTQAPAGSDPAKPAVPFIHQVLVDPTGKFLLAPDLSADLTHVFGFTENGMLSDPVDQMPLYVHEGSGPRHLVFYQPDGKKGKTYVYIVMEKKNMLHGYEVIYTATGTMEFKNIFMNKIFGGAELPAGSAAAEIKLTPDNKCLIISSRLDKLNFVDPKNPTSPSDTLVTFSLDPQTGIPKLLGLSSAGGLGPRSFAINKAGDRVAVALNGQNRVVIFKRHIETGKFAGQIGSLDLDVGAAPGLVSSVVWAEDGPEDIVVGKGTVNIAAASVTTSRDSSKGSSLPNGSSDSTATTNITIFVTHTVTLSSSPASTSSDSLPSSTKTRTFIPGEVSGFLTFPTNSLSPPTEFSSSMPVTSSSTQTSVRFPIITFSLSTGNNGVSTAVSPTSTNSNSISTLYSISTIHLNATPTPVVKGVFDNCHQFYQVKSGDTCEGICKATGLDNLTFLSWNQGIRVDCVNLVPGEWVCVGL